MVLPSVVAGSIFTFSLSLGDYIAVQIVGGKTQLIGNLIYANVARQQPAAGRRAGHGARRDHGGLPARRAPHRRPQISEERLVTCPGPRVALRVADGARLSPFIYVPLCWSS